MKTATRKLSKAAADTSVRDLRAAGLTPEDVIGRAAALAGLVDTPTAIACAHVAKLIVPSVRR